MPIDTKAVAVTLNKIMEYELAGTVRYTHYSLMTYGYNRIPIVSWLRGQATESLAHATAAGEVEDMLERLSESERAALVLCEGHGWTHTEAAQLLDIPLGTLKSTVARAKSKCRAMWEGADHG